MKKSYHLFEGLRMAMLTTFISGFINAYTYNTQGKVFAGAQTGNILGLAIYFTKGQFMMALSYLLPIIFFVLGQFFAYFGRKQVSEQRYWPLIAVKLMMFLLLVTICLGPVSPSYVTTTLLAFLSSIQLDAFPRVRGTIYANVMMTGNVRNAAAFWIRGFVENNQEIKGQAYYTIIAIFCFMLGAFIDTLITSYLFEYSLLLLIPPFALLYYFLRQEKR